MISKQQIVDILETFGGHNLFALQVRDDIADVILDKINTDVKPEPDKSTPAPEKSTTKPKQETKVKKQTTKVTDKKTPVPRSKRGLGI